MGWVAARGMGSGTVRRVAGEIHWPRGAHCGGAAVQAARRRGRAGRMRMGGAWYKLGAPGTTARGAWWVVLNLYF